SGVQGAVVAITLAGTNFVSGATSIGIVPSGVITAGSINAASATSLTANFTIPAGAAVGSYSVTVTTANGTSNAVSFAVTNTAMTITGMSPSAGTIDGGQRTILNGASIPAGPLTVTFGSVFGAGAQRLSATQIAVYTPPQAAGAVNVIVAAGG